METETHLCPCCAAHLRVPRELSLMRCNNCNAELTFIDTGSVRGLAMLPRMDANIPYSDPAQRAAACNIDGSELVLLRREVLLRDARRKHRLWSGFFLAVTFLFLGTIAVGVAGAGKVLSGARNHTEMELAATTFLLAVTVLPILMYVGLYFQGRARLIKDKIERSLQSPGRR